MESKPREVIYYVDPEGNYPAHNWLEKLKDKTTRVIIKGRIRRVEEGNLGFTRSIGHGLIELKIDHGPGYRVYLGIDGDTVIMILAAGDKSTQFKDIENAKARWQNYRETKK
jgi:putative addiction module killer protein